MEHIYIYVYNTLHYFPAVLFTVEAERSTYQSEFGGDVVMGCRFQPKLINPRDKLEVTWHRIKHSPRKVYRMDNGTEDLAFQDPDYRGRVMLRTEELKDGWAKLQVNTGSEVFGFT